MNLALARVAKGLGKVAITTYFNDTQRNVSAFLISSVYAAMVLGFKNDDDIPALAERISHIAATLVAGRDYLTAPKVRATNAVKTALKYYIALTANIKPNPNK
jgi:hypothetical protein